MKKIDDTLTIPTRPLRTVRRAVASSGETAVADAVRGLAGWYLADRRRTLGVKFRFQEQPQALQFLSQVSELAARYGATPHLVLTAGGQLHLRLRSRQEGGIGEAELAFARAVAAVVPGGSPVAGRLPRELR